MLPRMRMCYPVGTNRRGTLGMIAIIAAGAFIGLFILWVVLPRKFLKNK